MKGREIIKELSRLQMEVCDGIGAAALARKLHDMAHAIEPDEFQLELDQGKPKADAAHVEQAKKLHAYWQGATGHHGRGLTAGRKSAIVARLRGGASVDKIKHAIDGCMASEHHVNGGYTDLTLICRSEEKLDWFAEKGGWDDSRPVKTAGQVERYEDIDELKRQSREAMKRNDHAEYEQIQAQLKRALASR